jgi:hypothetical protein
MGLGLYGKELIAIDGSKFKAVNANDRNFTDGKLADRIGRLDNKITEYMAELSANDQEEDKQGAEKSSEKIGDIVKRLEERRAVYEGYKEEMAEAGESQKSLTDPESRLMMANGKMDVCYNVQTAVDAKNKLIAEFEVTNSAVDKNYLTPMALKTKEIFGVGNITAVADAGYDSVQDIVSGMNEGIDVHVAGTDFDICVPAEEESGEDITSQKDGRCVYYADRNIVLCPMGKTLYPRFYKKGKKCGVFYNNAECKKCACTCAKIKNKGRHEVPMEEADFTIKYNDEGLHVKQERITGNKTIIRERKSIVEHPFGTVKRNMDAAYCLTKGMRLVSGEFSLSFLAYNLKRAINIIGVSGMIECIS